MVQEDDDVTTPSPGTPSPVPSPNPTATPSSSSVPTTQTTEDGRLIVEAGELGWVDVLEQDSDLSEDGCGAIGCVEEKTRVRT